MILHNPIVSGSLTFASTATFTANNGSVSGSAQIISLLPDGVVSGSSQISLSGFNTSQLSENTNLYYTDTRVRDFIRSIDVISGSAQLANDFLEINGDSVISSSQQVVLNDADKTGFDTADVTEGSNLYYTVARVKLKMDQDGVISGSSQLTSTFDTRYLNTDGEGVVSGSEQISLSGFSTSNLSEGTNQYYTNTRVLNYVNDLGVISGSTFSSPSQGTMRATINGANTDVDLGLQLADSPQFTNLTLTGNLTVQGSTTTTNSNEVNIGDNIINLNYGGSSTTGGIYVKDGTGTSQISGSFIWDSADGRDYWKAGKLGSESEVITSTNIVSKLPAGTVSGSSQITITESQISDLDKYQDSDVQSYIRSIDVISGSSQVVLNDADKTGFNTADVSEHSTNLYYTDARVKTKLDAEGVISSSAQIGVNNPTITLTAGAGLDGGGAITLNQAGDETITFTVADGVISGSQQILDAVSVDEDNFASNSATKLPTQQSIKAYVDSKAQAQDNTDEIAEGSTNLYFTDARVKTKLNSETVVSGSSQITLSSTTGYNSNEHFTQGNITTLGTVTSGNVTSILPDGIVSGSIQVVLNDANKTGFDTADVAEGTNLYYTDARVKTKLDDDGVISGSQQILDSISVDEDNFASNSATKLPTQQSVKAYVDAQVDTKDALSELSGDTDDVTEGSSNLYYTDTRVQSYIRSQDVISGSQQVNADSITNFDTNVQNFIRSIDVISGSIQVDADNVTNFDNNVQSFIRSQDVISGSQQVDYDSIQNQPTTITSDQASKITANDSKVGYTDALVKTKLNAETVVSGSAQIALSGLSDYDANDHIDHSSITIGSGKGLSGGGTITTNRSIFLDTGSAHFTSGVKEKLNSEDIVSGSSQIDVTATTNYASINQYTDSDFDTRLASKSSTNLAEGTNKYYTDARVKTKLNAEEVVSGSYISTLNGTGVVSGSSQITLSSVTGYNSNEHFTQNSITTLGTVTSGDITALLPDGTVSGSSQVSVTLGTQTTGNYVATLGNGTGVTIGSNTGEGSNPTIAVDYGSADNTAVQGSTKITLSGTTNEIDITNGGQQSLGGGPSYTVGLADSIVGNRTFQNNVTISGNLVVSGDTTSASTTNTTISDKLIELGNGTTGAPAGDSGIVIERGDENNGFIGFDESADKFVVGTGTFVGSSTGNLAITKGTLLANIEGDLTGDVTGQTSDISNHDTDNLSEGSSNLYYTDARVQSYIRSQDVISGSSQITGLTASQLNDNSIQINGVDVELGNNITFESISNGTGTISGSSQLTSDFDSRYLNTNGDGIVSQSAQIDYDSIQNQPTTISTAQANEITANTLKNTNVTTNLSISGTTGARTIVSSDGTDAIIPIATTSVSGLLSPGLFDEIDVNTAKVGYTDALVKTKLNADTVISGSSQLLSDLDGRYLEINGDNVISGSAQVDYDSIQNQPTIPSVGNATITVTAGTDLGTGGNFTTNQSSNETITINHSNVSRTDTTSTDSPAYGETITAIDSVTTSARGHVTAVNVKTITLPSTDDTSYDLNVQAGAANTSIIRLAGSDSTNDDVTISGGTGITIAESGNTITITGTAQYGDSDVTDHLHSLDVISGSSQITITESQISDLDKYTNSDVQSYIRSIDVISGSATSVRSFLNVENGADVTDTTNVTAAGALMDSEVDADLKTFSLPANTTISSFGKTIVDDLDADAVRSTIGVDAAGTDNSTNVTIASGKDYISISGQELTLGNVDATSDISNLNTSNVGEGTNLYYTDTRVQSYIRSLDVISGSAGILDAVSIDEDNFASNSATKLPTQQSVKAYVDSKAQAQDNTDELTEGSTNLFYTDARVKTKINADGVVSGSNSEVKTFLSITASDVSDFDTEVSNNTSVAANTAKNTNVSTNLSEGTTTTTTVDVNSSDGTNATLASASTTRAGLLSKAKFDEIVANSLKVSDINHNVSTNLSEGTTTNTTVDINSSDGNNATLASASTSRAGLLSKAKFDEIVANTLKETDVNHNVTTNLSITGTTGARTIVSSDGTDAVIPIATTSVSGLLSPSLFDEIDANTAKNTNVSTDLGKTTAAGQITITSSDGNDVIIGEATDTIAGVMSTTHHDKLDGIDEGAQVNQSTATIKSNIGTGNGKLVPSAGTSGQFLKHDGTFGTPSYTSNSFRTITAGGNTLGGSETLAFTAGTNITITEAGGAVTITSTDTNDNTQLSDSEVQAIVGAMFSGNTETRISATYQSGDGTIDLVVNDMTANDNDDVSIANLKTRLAGGFGSNAVQIGDSTDTITIPGNLTVQGTQTINDVNLINTSNGVIFEGTTDDGFETTLTATDPTTDRAITLPNKSGTVAMTSDITGTNSGTNTGDETLSSINALDITEVGTISSGVWQGSAISTTYLSGQSGTNTGDETKASINALDITEVGTISSGIWQGSAISTTYIANTSGTNTGDETLSSINALDITEVGTITSGVWNGSAISTTYIANTSGTNTGDETKSSINALDITEVGTISSGVWQGTAIADAYLSSNTAHLSGTQTFSGEKTFSNILTVSNTTSTNATDTGALVVTGGVGIGGGLNVGGDVVAYASSDERLKDNIELISNPIEKVQSLKGVTWNWNDNADELQQSLPNVGVIAQDVEKVLPELVTDRDNGYKGVDYAKLTGLLIEAIKDQQKQIDDLKSKLK